MVSTLCWLFVVLVILVVFDSVLVEFDSIFDIVWLFMVLVIFEKLMLFIDNISFLKINVGEKKNNNDFFIYKN